MGAIGGSLGAAVVRYCCIDFHKLNGDERSKNYSTAQTLISIASGIYLLLALCSIFYLELFLNVEEKYLFEVYCLVVTSVISFVLGLNESLFTSVFSAKGKVYLISLLSILYNIVKFSILWIYLEEYNSLYFYCIVEGIISASKLVLAWWMFRLLKTGINIKLTWKLSIPTNGIVSMTIWGVVAGIGFSLFRKTELLLINNFISTEVAGYVAIIMVWSGLLVVIASQITSFLGSYLTPIFAIEGPETFNKSRVFFNRIAAAMSGTVAAIALYHSSELLPLWANTSAIKEYLIPHYWFLIGTSFILSQSVNMVTFTVLAKLKTFSLILCGFGILYVLACYVLLQNGYGVKTIAIAYACVNFLLYQVLVSGLSARYCNSKFDFVEIMIYIVSSSMLYIMFSVTGLNSSEFFLNLMLSVFVSLAFWVAFFFILIYMSKQKGVMPEIF
ncbi:MAG: hypothetical protein C0422_13640 [Alcaligenaceae bacterium]|nr:hypothetical protein [Alcaligenaceae bacterium]